MVIGGASIYFQLIDYADKMLLTQIDNTSLADTFFPKFDDNDWNIELIKIVEENL